MVQCKMFIERTTVAAFMTNTHDEHTLVTSATTLSGSDTAAYITRELQQELLAHGAHAPVGSRILGEAKSELPRNDVLCACAYRQCHHAICL
jgi:hypothetical protein